MKTKITGCLTLVFVVYTLNVCKAQSKTNWLNDLSWLNGHWKGEAFGGTVEEIWNSSGNVILGMFWHSKDNKITFSEYEQISELDGVLSFKVKHFNTDFKGWEEKDKFVDFKFISMSENEVKFEGLTLQKVDNTTCKHIIKLKDSKTGESKDVEILYRKVGP